MAAEKRVFALLFCGQYWTGNGWLNEEIFLHHFSIIPWKRLRLMMWQVNKRCSTGKTRKSSVLIFFQCSNVIRQLKIYIYNVLDNKWNAIFEWLRFAQLLYFILLLWCSEYKTWSLINFQLFCQLYIPWYIW